ncbi:rRNA pseudouridine synthase [Candidatus Kaiserbacteria bacterium]|nr:rRNA pseudouridine synthase [Candidatus Kaiserbacteria bacterium]
MTAEKSETDRLRRSMKKISHPIRINQYLHLKGYCSRRQADRLIEEGAVMINGATAKLGAKIFENDVVKVSKRNSAILNMYAYFAYHKPRGVISHSPQMKEVSVREAAKLRKDFSPVGRLDKASSGLMLLTNDGRIVEPLLNPRYGHEREYVVKVDKKIKNMFLKKMRGGVQIEGYVTKPAAVERIDDLSFRITLTEGKKHQIRRMAAALGYQVRELTRTRIMHIKLGGLKKGEARELTQKERRELLKVLAIQEA